jgi:hypothetical protein
MEEAVRPNAAVPASVEADGASLLRREHVLELGIAALPLSCLAY